VALPALRKALSDKDDLVRRNVTEALLNLGPTAAPAVAELTKVLDDDRDALARRHAARALGGLGAQAQSAIPTLEKCAQDRDWTLRQEAADALARIRGQR
jgi:HEAT repeat protein